MRNVCVIKMTEPKRNSLPGIAARLTAAACELGSDLRFFAANLLDVLFRPSRRRPVKGLLCHSGTGLLEELCVKLRNAQPGALDDIFSPLCLFMRQKYRLTAIHGHSNSENSRKRSEFSTTDRRTSASLSTASSVDRGAFRWFTIAL